MIHDAIFKYASKFIPGITKYETGMVFSFFIGETEIRFDLLRYNNGDYIDILLYNIKYLKQFEALAKYINSLRNTEKIKCISPVDSESIVINDLYYDLTHLQIIINGKTDLCKRGYKSSTPTRGVYKIKNMTFGHFYNHMNETDFETYDSFIHEFRIDGEQQTPKSLFDFIVDTWYSTYGTKICKMTILEICKILMTEISNNNCGNLHYAISKLIENSFYYDNSVSKYVF